MGGWADAIQTQIENSSLGRVPIKCFTTTFTSAQLLLIGTVPIQLAPAPGPNKFYLVLASQCHYRFGTVPYTTAGSGALRIFGSTYANAHWLLCNAAALLLLLVDSFSQGSFFSNNIPATTNQPMLVSGNGVNVAAGDGTLTCNVCYTIMDASIS